jgi:hypothetical protein
MRTIFAPVAVCAVLAAIAGSTPAAAMPIANIAATAQNSAGTGNYLNVRWYGRHYRHWRRYGYWRPRHRYWGPRYRAYGYYPHYRRYWGPHVSIGPRGFHFGVW